MPNEFDYSDNLARSMRYTQDILKSQRNQSGLNMPRKIFFPRPNTGTGELAMRVNSDFDEQRNRIRMRVLNHIFHVDGAILGLNA